LIIAHRFAIGTHNQDFGLKFIALWRSAPIHHDLLGHASRVIGFIANCDAADEVDIFHCA